MIDASLIDQRRRIAHQIEELEESQEVAPDTERGQITLKIEQLTKKLQDVDIDLSNQSSMEAGSE